MRASRIRGTWKFVLLSHIIMLTCHSRKQNRHLGTRPCCCLRNTARSTGDISITTLCYEPSSGVWNLGDIFVDCTGLIVALHRSSSTINTATNDISTVSQLHDMVIVTCRCVLYYGSYLHPTSMPSQRKIYQLRTCSACGKKEALKSTGHVLVSLVIWYQDETICARRIDVDEPHDNIDINATSRWRQTLRTSTFRGKIHSNRNCRFAHSRRALSATEQTRSQATWLLYSSLSKELEYQRYPSAHNAESSTASP